MKYVNCENEKVKKMLMSWFVTYGFYYDPKKFREVTNGRRLFLNKPDGGLWSSPMNSEFGWKDWCVSENYIQRFGFSCGFKYKLKKGTNIYVIDSLHDFNTLLERYGEIFSQIYGGKFLNWEKIKEDYSGVLLTDNGERETRYTGLESSLYGWDCETLVIFDLNVISEVKSLGGRELMIRTHI